MSLGVLVHVGCARLRIKLSRFALAIISTASDVVSRLAFVGARVARSIALELEIPSLPIIKACSCTDTTRKSLSARVSSLLYIFYIIAPPN